MSVKRKPAVIIFWSLIIFSVYCVQAGLDDFNKNDIVKKFLDDPKVNKIAWASGIVAMGMYGCIMRHEIIRKSPLKALWTLGRMGMAGSGLAYVATLGAITYSSMKTKK